MKTLLIFVLLFAGCGTSDANNGNNGSTNNGESDAGDLGTDSDVPPTDDSGTVDQGNDAGASDLLSMVDCPSMALTDANAVCGRFTVDEARDISIGYALVPAQTEPASDGKPLLMLVGGPSPSGVFLIGGDISATGSSKFLRNDRDVILVDYRGVGLSSPTVSCPPPDGLDALPACKDAVDGSTLTFDDFRTATFAADIDALLGELGHESVIVWGGSYGTRVALTMMRDVPSRISHVILDGVFPPEVNGFTESAEAPLGGLAFIADRCASTPECANAFGDLRPKIGTIAETASQTAFSVEIMQTISQFNRHRAAPLLVDFLSTLDTNELVDAGMNLAAISYDDVDGENDPNIDPALIDQAFSIPMSFGIVCSEEEAFINQQPFDASTFGFPASVNTIFAEFQGGADFPPSFAPMICDTLEVDDAPAIEIEPVVSDIPTLVVSGGMDMQTSPNWGTLAANSLSTSTHVIIPLSGHIATGRNVCAQQIITSFLSDASAALDTSCSDLAQLTLTSNDVIGELATP